MRATAKQFLRERWAIGIEIDTESDDFWLAVGFALGRNPTSRDKAEVKAYVRQVAGNLRVKRVKP